MLRVHEGGHQTQIARNRVTVGKLAQALGTRRKDGVPLGKANARNSGSVKGFDFAGLQDSLSQVAPRR